VPSSGAVVFLMSSIFVRGTGIGLVASGAGTFFYLREWCFVGLAALGADVDCGGELIAAWFFG
jgi:hypothetical protein